MREIDKVTAADVQRVAKDIFKDKKLNLAVIAPKADVAKLKKMLTLA
jgi:predicted Zn-dependent peptidase